MVAGGGGADSILAQEGSRWDEGLMKDEAKA
jgi:hypothetical protein